MTDRNDLARALSDVRKAYRLLQGYHRRLNDILFRVAETVGKQGLIFERWGPQNVDRLPGPSKPFFSSDKWAWDLTPAYQVWCTWSSPPKQGRVRRIGLVAVADTGYDDRSDGEPDPVKFPDAAKCESEIWIAAWTTSSKAPNWAEAWKVVQEIPNYYNGETHERTINGAKYSYRYLKTVDVADLINPSAVEKHLLAPIKQWLDESSASR